MTTTELNTIKERFIKAFLVDDIDTMMELVDEDCEWVVMATGETFRGAEKVRYLAEKSVASRKHTRDNHMIFTDSFAGEDHLCFEYIHRAVWTAEGVSMLKQASTGTLAPYEGMISDIKICIVCRVKNGKIDHLNEYFDLGQVSKPAGSSPHMYT
jgi:ketosteroid isomerase-like protein